jgi:hypothetical protein
VCIISAVWNIVMIDNNPYQAWFIVLEIVIITIIFIDIGMRMWLQGLKIYWK